MKHTRVVSLNARQVKPGVHLLNTTLIYFIVSEHIPSVPIFITHAYLNFKKYIHLCDEICICFQFKVGNWFCSLYQVDWWNNRLLLVLNSYEVVAMVETSGHYGYIIVRSYTKINKTVSRWLLTTCNLCTSVICAFHISCTHPPQKLLICTGEFLMI